MQNIDFTKIRSYKGSQNNAFEKLICQLARLTPPKDAISFIRKEGAGGDAGVECFWKIKDGSEHAWQAKYFFKVNDSQWRQISKSVETALKKHPKLKKYYICLPLDRTDSRQNNKKSLLNKWNEKVKQWKQIAKEKNMNVEFEFEFWGASEILDMLSTDDPCFSGRALYWFNFSILQIQSLKDITEKSKKSLGDRFSPEFHVDLPIAKTFDAVGLTPNWYKRFYSVAEKWLTALDELNIAIAEKKNPLEKTRWNPIKEYAIEIEALLKQTIKEKSLYKNTNQLKENITNLKKINDTITDIERNINRRFNLFNAATYKLSEFLSSKDMKAFFTNAKKWLKSLDELKTIIAEEKESLTKTRWNPIKEHSIKIEALLKQTIKEKSLYKNTNQLKENITNLKKINDTITDIERNINRRFNLFNDATYELSEFLSSKDMKAFSTKSILLSGDAGAGKSHLLCDIALKRLGDNLPTVFLLGQYYDGGNPLKFISDSLDLKNNSHKEILGALDALGESRSTRTLIIIDAVNEGPYKEQWRNYIINLIVELKKYPHISFVFSCRSTYLKYLLPLQQINEEAVEIKHQGFSNIEDIYKYLEKQNIFVPNTPIMEPEFSNPLFLKIYCKFLKEEGNSGFSNNSIDIETIFNFYVNHVSKNINRNKEYRTGERIALKALQSFALQLFPNNLHGLQTEKAREIIKAEDPNPNKNPLFNELLNEGILSEDIIRVPYKDSDTYSNKKEWNTKRGHGYREEPVVRFTYERFSDYFIVKHLVEKEIYKKPKKVKKIINQIKYFFHRIISKEYCLKEENLKLYFRKGSVLGNIFFRKDWGLNGIVEALFIKIANDFKEELYDLIEIDDNQYLSVDPLKKSFLSRSSDSFTQRTYELLSQLQPIEFHSPILQILLKLSIKPNHPWNADKLHKILINKTLAERDKFWSTHIFFSYHDPEYLTINNLIDWPYSNYFKNMDMDPEHVRLYIIVLTWLTTSSHRELRDKATKSIIVILSKYPKLLLGLMDQFSEVNDLYVRERLYAVAYGVTVNIEDKDLIKKIAEKTYEQVFKTRKPVPHILLRNYARCILEFAYQQKLLPDEIDLQSFCPPYKSDWPIENPMDSEIDALVDSKKIESVHYSLMGFTGDFGIYTMNCVHSFSPTLLTKEHPETGTELQRKFIDKLSDNQKKFYYEYLKKEFKDEFGKNLDENYNSEYLIKCYNSLRENHRKQSSKEKNIFMETLNEKQKEYMRWLFDGRFMDDRPAAFSRKWAKRWVCKQVYEMGWRKELFEKFDTDHIFSLRDEGKESLERIGKKYQWIAFHSLLAHLSDNVHYIRGYDDKAKYENPWHNVKDIDPSCYLRKTGDNRQLENISSCWGQPHVFNFPEESVAKQEEWFKLERIEFPFKNTLQIEDPTDNSSWTVLYNYVDQKQKLSLDQKEEGFCKPECWFRISAVIVSKKDRDVLREKINNKDLRSYHIAEGGRISRFLKDYPICDDECNNDWREYLSGHDIELKIKNLRPYVEYNWESGNTDYSIDRTISFYLPSKTLIDKLKLKCLPGQFENWVNNDNISVFKDPSITSKGPSCPLVKTDILNSWLNKDNLCLVWLVGGEKRLYEKDGMPRKRHDFSGIYFANGNKIEGDMWFLNISQMPRDK